MPPIPVLFEDDHLIAVDKPSGLLVHRSVESKDRVFLLQTVARRRGEHLFPVHRLDRAASGVILFGRSSEDARWIQTALHATDTKKEYFVLVRGPAPASGESERRLTDDHGVRRECRTTFVRERLFPYCSLLRVRIHTGRRHQIRRHLAHLALHVLGDTTYGKGRLNQLYREKYGLDRLFLHASSLELTHGVTGARLSVVAPVPAALAQVLAKLDTEAETLEALET